MGAEVIKKAPALCSKEASAEELRQLFDKDTIFSLPRQQKRTSLLRCPFLLCKGDKKDIFTNFYLDLNSRTIIL